MVEIEIGVMVRQCLDRRIADMSTLIAEVAKWEQRRNREQARIEWLFTVDRAREKLGRAYPTTTNKVCGRSKPSWSGPRRRTRSSRSGRP
jgi:hypothetical protein